MTLVRRQFISLLLQPGEVDDDMPIGSTGGFFDGVNYKPAADRQSQITGKSA
jgi:hypothetical protein